MHTNRAASRRLIFKPALLAWLVAGLLPAVACAATLPGKAAAARAAEPSMRQHVHCADGANAFTRIDLFFGLSKPGGVITAEEFKAFVDAQVTPRFPDGLTLQSGTGQFRDASGTIVVEGSMLLILLVPARDLQASAKVEAIRNEYRVQFQQESVLRSDSDTCTSF